ncbi:MAG: hypothetical protein Aurels2KO_53680 [Aureliella sp.]
MRFILLLLCTTAAGIGYAQDAGSIGLAENGNAKKYTVLISEISLAKAVTDQLSLEQVAADYERLVKSGDCRKRQSLQFAMWDDREFEFVQTSDVNLQTRLGFGLRMSVITNGDKITLKLEYQHASVDELTPDTKTSDVKTISGTADIVIAPRKRLAIQMNSAGDETFLLVTLLPARAARPQPN